MVFPLPRRAPVDRNTGLFLLLLLVVLVPTACLLWFMNEAVAVQSSAARQSVLDAYRGQLRLVRSRIDVHWKASTARLQHHGTPEETFARLVLDEAAEGILVFDDSGRLVFPQAASQDDSVRELDTSPQSADSIARVAARLNDYSTTMPSSARLMMMTSLRARSPNVSLPTESALRLSVDVVQSGVPARDSSGFRPTLVPEVWALASDDHRVVGLYRTGRLEAMMHDALHEVAPEGITFLAFPPGVEADTEAIAAGDWLPGWQLSFMPVDTRIVDAASKSRTTFYVSVGVAGISIVALLGIGAGGAFRRQLQLARLKTDLVAAVSHELRTPLTSMRVLVDGLLADEKPDPVKTREYLELIATENSRLSRLIENFLTFSRLERGRRQFVFSPVEPAAVVAAAIAAIRERVPANCVVSEEVAPGLPRVTADADALVTALVNLLDNALKYTPPDKIISVRVSRDRGFVSFTVEDNGIGIPAHEHRRIFHRYYRIDRRLSGETTGVGLGLSIVDLIVRAHGGTVAVRSDAGSGSTFVVRVPCVAGGVTE